MVKIYIASGYDSWNNKELRKGFVSKLEADNFLEGLTNPNVHVISGKSYIDIFNSLIKGV